LATATEQPVCSTMACVIPQGRRLHRRLPCAGVVLAVFTTTFLTSFAMQFRISRCSLCHSACLCSQSLPCVKFTMHAHTSRHICSASAAGGIPSVCRGLEQQVALPRDSYLQQYFADVTSVMRTGPPLFFVVSKAAVWLLHATGFHIMQLACCTWPDSAIFAY
jgi:hypothetical protein